MLSKINASETIVSGISAILSRGGGGGWGWGWGGGGGVGGGMSLYMYLFFEGVVVTSPQKIGSRFRGPNNDIVFCITLLDIILIQYINTVI